MGTLPQLSILKGPTRPHAPKRLEKIIETQTNGDVALIFEEDEICRFTSYEELNSRSNQMARYLIQLIRDSNQTANGDGDFIVAVKMHPNDHLIVVLLAILKAGAAYLPLDHSFPQARIDHILKEAQPVLIVDDLEDESTDYNDRLSVKFDDLTRNLIKFQQNNLDDSDKLGSSHIAFVLYTSGSTGVPKGVRLPHQVILNRLYWQFKRFPYANDEKVCVFKTALTFVDSVSEIWGPLINGLTILVLPKALTKDPEKFVDVLERYEVQRLVLVPSLLKSILLCLKLHKNQRYLDKLVTWVCSGETLLPTLVDEFYDYFTANRHCLCNFYGSTEVMGDVTYHVVSVDDHRKHGSIPIGVPLDNTVIYLLDTALRPVKSGEIGELFASGANLAAGYVAGRDPHRFIDNPLAIDPIYARLYRTGDYARISDGVLIYEGRTDSQVKIRGHRVDLSEVQEAVATLDGVEKAVVLCKTYDMHQVLLAFVQTDALLSENQIEAMLKKKLTNYMVPQVVLVEEVPLLVNGKVDRQELLKMYETTNNNGDTNYEVEIDYTGITYHQAEKAKILFETVADVLGRTTRSVISAKANFYDIGGNSLNSIFTISKLKEQGYHIGISDFISAMDFGEVIERMSSTDGVLCKIQPPRYSRELLKNEHQSHVIDMITSSFLEKADLEQYLKPQIKPDDYTEMIVKLWESLIAQNLSFIVKNEYDKHVGVCLNFDVHNEPMVEIQSALYIIFDFLEYVEGPIRDNQLPQGKGKVVHSFMMGTHSSLSPKENVAVMSFMEQENLALAKSNGYEGIFTTNTSPLTKQLGTDIYKYTTLLEYQINQYVNKDNCKPFGKASDSETVHVQWKSLKD